MNRPIRPIRPIRPGSLRAKLLAFFQARPDEHLSRQDIVRKYSVALLTVDSCLRQMIDEGEARRVRPGLFARGDRL